MNGLNLINQVKDKDYQVEQILMVFVTVASEEEGKRIGSILVENQLAACVNMVPQIFSIFRWQGNIENEKEILLLIKTTENRVDALIDKVKEIHSYDVPEILAIPVFTGNKDYIDWVVEETKNG